MVKINFITDMINFIKNETKCFTKNQHKRKYALDLIIKEIIYVLKSGTSWELYRGPINKDSLYYNFKILNKAKVFQKYYKYLIDRYYKTGIYDTLKYTSIDTTFIPNSYGVKEIGRNKQYKWKNGNKISLICNSKGIPFSIYIAKGNESDSKLFMKNINDLYIDTKSYLHKNNNRFKQYLLADAIYDTKLIKKKVIELGYIPIIDYNKRNTKDPKIIKANQLTKKQKKIYKKRIVIENTNLFKKQNKRLLNRADKDISTFTSFIFLAFIRFLTFKLKDTYEVIS